MKTQDLSSTQEGWQPTREEVSQFLRQQPLCVISTLGEEGNPQGATVAFSETEDGNLIIGTDRNSRKATNIARDSRASLTITDADKRYTVQLEGEGRILDQAEFAKLEAEHYRQLPASRPFKDQPGQVHILIKPKHIRFTDCNPHPWLISEFDC